ncbi:hypothetical protein [Bradyrhizobium sp. UFLA05-112]
MKIIARDFHSGTPALLVTKALGKSMEFDDDRLDTKSPARSSQVRFVHFWTELSMSRKACGSVYRSFLLSVATSASSISPTSVQLKDG